MDAAKLKIAMVDDHILLRKGLASLINTFDGFEVSLEAGNGRDFIGQLQNEPAPDIVLLDINMPEMNGYETAGWIRRNLPDVKILVLSMLDTDLAIIRMLNLGARGFLRKDSHPNQFRAALVQLREQGFCLTEGVSPVPPQAAPGLTDKDHQFLRLSCSQLSYREIASEMGVSPRNVENQRDTLFTRLQVYSRVGLVLYAIKNGIVMV